MKTNTPYFMSNIDVLLERLQEEGAQLKDLTNEWEVARWKWNDKTLIIYKTKHGFLSFSDYMAYEQYCAALSQEAWPHKLLA